jgi:signal transduction histidine kinase
MDKHSQISKSTELKTVLRISQAVSRTLDLDKILEMSCRMTAQALNVDRCSIGLLNTTGDSHRIVHTYRKKLSYPSIDGISFKVTQLPNISQKLMSGKIAHLFNTQKSEFSAQEKNIFQQLNLKTFLAVPIVVDRKPLGAFHLARVEKFIPFSRSDINLCRTIANQVGIAVKNANLLKDLQSKYDQQNVILNISKSLFQTLNLQELFNLITQKTCEVLKIDRCSISTFDQERKQATIRSIYYFKDNRLSYKGKHDPLYVGMKYSICEVPQVYKLLRKGRIFLAENILSAQLTPKARKHILDIGAKTILAIPIFIDGKLSGILSVSTIKNIHMFNDSEIKICQTIANLASLSLKNVKLMQNLQEKSAQIQKQAEVLEKQFKEQTILLEISKALSQTLDLKKLFSLVTQKTVELLGVDRAVAMLIDQNTGDHLLFTHFSRVKHLPELENYPKSVEDFPYIIERIKTRQIFSVSDVAKSSLSSREKKYFRKRSIKSVLSIAFILEGKLLGVLALNSITKKYEFTEPEIKLAQAIANQLSVAIENSRLLELSKKHSKELEKLSLRIINAQEDERKNLAGKLHDVIAQDLTAIKFDLKMCQHTLPEQYSPIREKLEECENLVTQSLENVRNITSDLRPPILDHFGLVSTIRWYIDSFQSRTNLKIKVKMPKLNYKFPPEFETTIYRIIQEGLTNVVKHSQAKRASVSLYKKGNYVRIIIQDNGVGFELENLPHVHGFGLFKLKENTELLGGKFKIISNKGRGTKFDITLPCEEKI